MTFIRVFMNEKEACAFALTKGAKVSIQYDYDELTRTIVRKFVVKY